MGFLYYYIAFLSCQMVCCSELDIHLEFVHFIVTVCIPLTSKVIAY